MSSDVGTGPRLCRKICRRAAAVVGRGRILCKMLWSAMVTFWGKIGSRRADV